MKTLIHEFNTNKTPDLSKIGGKAKSLIETTKAGFNVPKGFVLSVDFFTNWINEIKTTSVWKDFLGDQTRETCDALKKITSRLKFTKEQKEALKQALKGFTAASVFAVRSSSPEEDLRDTSFAGMYDTILGVTYKTLEISIVTAFTSMFDIRVVEYKKLNNKMIDDPLIAVIVQKQIASEISGIAFSINPNNNCFDEAMISASFGLGETIVSGQVTPDTYIVEKVKSIIIEKNIAAKIQGLWLLENGGTITKKNRNPQAQALNDEQILSVSDLVSECEKYYGQPIDAEWAISQGKLYLLQARPITAYNPLFPEMLTKPGEKKTLYLDIVVLSQGFMEPFSTLGLGVWSKMLYVAKQGIMPEGKDGIILNIHGRQYMNISNMLLGWGEQDFLKIMANYETPVKKILESIDLEEYVPAVKSKKIVEMSQALTEMYASMASHQEQDFSDAEKSSRSYQKIADQTLQYLKGNLNTDQNFKALVDDGLNQFKLMVAGAMSINSAVVAFANINEMFKGKGVDDFIVALGMALPHNPTSEMGYAMVELASFTEIQNTRSAQEFSEKISKKTYSAEVLSSYQTYMDKFRARGFKEIDIATPRVYERPADFFNQLKHIRIGDNAMTTVKERKEKAYKQLLAIAKKNDQEKEFVKYAKTYTSLMGYREHPKYIYVILVDKLRAVALTLGKQFKDQGRLQFVEQIFDMSIEEVALAQNNPDLDLLAVIEKNLKPRRKVAHIKDWPKIVNSRGKIFRYIRQGEKGDLIGDPIAPGLIQGRAKVLNTPYEKNLEKGEILIARATEPAWTPVFINAAGVVLEIGGPMQHGAIIAREYGIPCVSGINNVTTIIKDGDFVEVDGSSGLVKILKKIDTGLDND
ncbi:MAG: PEP/pyruvate-binding domain-containing protein [Acetobacterium sp.]